MSFSTIIIFFIILLVLVTVHEFGHFIAAKLLGIRVDEFAFGFPPKLFSKKIGETEYILNALPLGGYVKIHGEDGTEENKKDKRSFASKRWYEQSIVLVAGVCMNFLLAYVIFIGLALGTKTVSENDPLFVFAKDKSLVIAEVSSMSPAEQVGIVPGDIVKKVSAGEDILVNVTPESVISFIQKHQDGVRLSYVHAGGDIQTVELAPVYGIIKDKKALGIALTLEGKVKLPFFLAVRSGIHDTHSMISLIAHGFKDFFVKLFTGENIAAELAGPVGVAKAVHSAQSIGYETLFILAAVLSLNLGFFNILPFPALDGGRFAIVLGETLFRRKIKNSVFIKINAFGFLFLMVVFVLVTGREILHMFIK